MGFENENNHLENDIPHKILEEALRDSSKKAVDEAFALGIPIMVEKEGKLIEIYPDGKEVPVPVLNEDPSQSEKS